MKRLTFKFCWLILTGFVITGLFVIKNEVISLERELKQINEQMLEDRREIHVLSAEWAHLSDPQRLRELAGEYANLRPLKAEKIISFSSIPLKSAAVKNPAQTGIIRVSYAPERKQE